MPKGAKFGGREKGSLNKRTLRQLAEASERAGEIKRSGKKRAIEVLDDLMQTSMSFAARYQQRIVAATNQGTEPSQVDLDHFWKAMECAGVFAKALGPFQDPTFKAITVQTGQTALPGDDAREINPNVVPLNDAVALTKAYQRMIRQVR